MNSVVRQLPILRRGGGSVVALLLMVPLLAGCGSDESAPSGAASSPRPSATTSSASTAPTAPTPATPPSGPTRTSEPAQQAPVEGIDASHHQGPIDWRAVAGAGIEFAYLKATEGVGFTDPRFAAHRRAATDAGVAVNGYHFFQLCRDGRAQAEHFLAVLTADGVRPDPDLPPALDLELAGSCSSPPPARALLAQVRAFLDLVDRRLGTTTLVYLYPEFEERFGFADDLADHPQWVRRLGSKEPTRAWQVWQYDDSGTVPGVRGGVDRNRRVLP